MFGPGSIPSTARRCSPGRGPRGRPSSALSRPAQEPSLRQALSLLLFGSASQAPPPHRTPPPKPRFCPFVPNAAFPCGTLPAGQLPGCGSASASPPHRFGAGAALEPLSGIGLSPLMCFLDYGFVPSGSSSLRLDSALAPPPGRARPALWGWLRPL